MYEKNIKQYLIENGFNKFEPKAVLFDMDGVLYDSMPNHAQSWHKSMAKFGIEMSPEEAYQYEGMRGVETIKHIAGKQWGRALTDAEADKIYTKLPGAEADPRRESTEANAILVKNLAI